MKDRIQEELVNGNFSIVKDILNDYSYDEIRNIILEVSYNIEKMETYFFVLYILSEQETADYHILASELLAQPFSYYTGAYYGGLYHLRCAIKLNPNDISYKEYLLFFYILPDQLISKDEALKTANEILKHDFKNEAALDILERIKI